VTCGPSLLDGDVHDHVDGGPGGDRCVALEIVNASDLLVASHTEPSLVFAHPVVWVAFDLDRPGPRKKIGSSRHGLFVDNIPGLVGFEGGNLFSHCGENLI
jgi:hypothetical protein